MSEVTKRTYGAKRQTFQRISPRAAIMKNVESGKYTLDDEGREQCEKDMFEEFGGDGDFWMAAWSYYHTNNWYVCVQDLESRRHLKKRIAEKEKERQKRQDALNKSKKEVRQKINDYLMVTLDTTMPNGKQLGDCTKDEVLKIGGFYGRVMKLIAVKMKDDQKVSDAWASDEVEKLK